MEQNSADLAGLSANDAKEYIAGFITTLKLTEQEIRSLEEEAVKWKNRVELARSRSAEDPKAVDLLAEAMKKTEELDAKLNGLRDEAQTLRSQIETMRRQLPSLAARQRSIDPDLLEQELLMALGRTGEEAGTEREFRKLEKNDAADSALEALKKKMNNPDASEHTPAGGTPAGNTAAGDTPAEHTP